MKYVIKLDNNGKDNFLTKVDGKKLKWTEKKYNAVKFNSIEEAEETIYQYALNGAGAKIEKVEFYTISKEDFDKIDDCYKGVWYAFNGELIEYKGNRTVFEGCISDKTGASLLIEGLHFEVI